MGDNRLRQLHSILRSKASADKVAYLNGIADGVEEGHRTNNLAAAYKAMKLLSSSRLQRNAMAVHKANGEPSCSKKEILERWREHYLLMLNHPPANTFAELDLLRFTTEDSSMSSACPTLAEVRAAIKSLRNGRASGPGNIPPEFLKIALDPVSSDFTLLLRVWSTGLVPSEWSDGIIVSLYKGKGSRVECSSYRPIPYFLPRVKFSRMCS